MIKKMFRNEYNTRMPITLDKIFSNLINFLIRRRIRFYLQLNQLCTLKTFV